MAFVFTDQLGSFLISYDQQTAVERLGTLLRTHFETIPDKDYEKLADIWKRMKRGEPVHVQMIVEIYNDLYQEFGVYDDGEPDYWTRGWFCGGKYK